MLTDRTLIVRSLRYYWRRHAVVVLGAATGCAILTGALAVGDSVRYSLKRIMLERLGEVELALQLKDRTVRATLAERLAPSLQAVVAPVLHLPATAINPSDNTRANRVQVYGVDHRFWRLMGKNLARDAAAEEGAILNARMSRRLGIQQGGTVLLRLKRSTPLPGDALFSPEEDHSMALRLPVTAVAPDTGPGRFSLRTDTPAALNVFVSLTTLQKTVDLSGQANLLLVGRGTSTPLTVQGADVALRKSWQLADARLELRELPDQQALELRTDRVFLDPPTVRSTERAAPGATGVLAYLVNELRVGDRATPYSMVAAVGVPQGTPSHPRAPGAWRTTPPTVGMRDDEILLHPWVAEDLQAKPGDRLRLAYLVLGPMRNLKEQTAEFRVRKILPAEHPWWDPELMPLFPGLEASENCRDWDPGYPLDLSQIRKKDEDYWDRYRGTPKAFVTLAAGQRMWANRFGNLTAVRYPLDGSTRQEVKEAIRASLDPSTLGLFFRPVKAQALAAVGQAVNFGHLFLGFSFFLIIAALSLTALFFAFGVEQRAEEIGTLLALGFTPSRVRRLLWMEGATLAVVGGLLGAAGGVAYTQGTLYGLTSLWQDAVGGVSLTYHVEPTTLIAGTLAGICCAILAITVNVRRQARRPVRELLAPGASVSVAPASDVPARPKTRTGLWIALGSSAGALGLLGVMAASQGAPSAAAFFAAGALLLTGGLGLCHWLLTVWDRASGTRRFTLGGFALRNVARRRGRSLATVWLLACGSFLIVAVSANRHDPHKKAHHPSSGTGGFALVGESTLPVLRDLNSQEGREHAGLTAEDMEGVSVVSLRVRDGDDASCLSLNRAQVPRLLGVNPQLLKGRFTFMKTFPKPQKGDDAWQLLDRPFEGDVVPAIGDQATVVWGLGKSVGETIPFTNEAGTTVQLLIVGILADSMLQGSLLVAEDTLVRQFPSTSGYRLFLIDAPPGRAREVAGALDRALEDLGMDLKPAADRLAEFKTIENTYLSIFLALGGLGLLLGSLGLGAVLLRNVQERLSELALLRAVGFKGSLLLKLIVREHWVLLLAGLGCGVVAGLLAVLPVLASPGAEVPYRSLALMLGAVLVTGLFWTYLAGRLALRGPLLTALRGE